MPGYVPENGRTMRPYWIIPTSLARVERPVRISIKNFKLQARSEWPHSERADQRAWHRAGDYRMPSVIRMHNGASGEAI